MTTKIIDTDTTPPQDNPTLQAATKRLLELLDSHGESVGMDEEDRKLMKTLFENTIPYGTTKFIVGEGADEQVYDVFPAIEKLFRAQMGDESVDAILAFSQAEFLS